MIRRLISKATVILTSASGALLIFCSLTATAYAQQSAPVPEIDAGTATSAIALLTGGMLLLRSRFRAK